MFVLLVREEVEGEDYGSVGRVFEWDHAVGGAVGLHAAEDVFDCGLREQGVRSLVEGA